MDGEENKAEKEYWKVFRRIQKKKCLESDDLYEYLDLLISLINSMKWTPLIAMCFQEIEVVKKKLYDQSLSKTYTDAFSRVTNILGKYLLEMDCKSDQYLSIIAIWTNIIPSDSKTIREAILNNENIFKRLFKQLHSFGHMIRQWDLLGLLLRYTLQASLTSDQMLEIAKGPAYTRVRECFTNISTTIDRHSLRVLNKINEDSPEKVVVSLTAIGGRFDNVTQINMIKFDGVPEEIMVHFNIGKPGISFLYDVSTFDKTDTSETIQPYDIGLENVRKIFFIEMPSKETFAIKIKFKNPDHNGIKKIVFQFSNNQKERLFASKVIETLQIKRQALNVTAASSITNRSGCDTILVNKTSAERQKQVVMGSNTGAPPLVDDKMDLTLIGGANTETRLHEPSPQKITSQMRTEDIPISLVQDDLNMDCIQFIEENQCDNTEIWKPQASSAPNITQPKNNLRLTVVSTPVVSRPSNGTITEAILKPSNRKLFDSKICNESQLFKPLNKEPSVQSSQLVEIVKHRSSRVIPANPKILIDPDKRRLADDPNKVKSTSIGKKSNSIVASEDVKFVSTVTPTLNRSINLLGTSNRIQTKQNGENTNNFITKLHELNPLQTTSRMRTVVPGVEAVSISLAQDDPDIDCIQIIEENECDNPETWKSQASSSTPIQRNIPQPKNNLRLTVLSTPVASQPPNGTITKVNSKSSGRKLFDSTIGNDLQPYKPYNKVPSAQSLQLVETVQNRSSKVIPANPEISIDPEKRFQSTDNPNKVKSTSIRKNSNPIVASEDVEFVSTVTPKLIHSTNLLGSSPNLIQTKQNGQNTISVSSNVITTPKSDKNLSVSVRPPLIAKNAISKAKNRISKAKTVQLKKSPTTGKIKIAESKPKPVKKEPKPRSLKPYELKLPYPTYNKAEPSMEINSLQSTSTLKISNDSIKINVKGEIKLAKKRSAPSMPNTGKTANKKSKITEPSTLAESDTPDFQAPDLTVPEPIHSLQPPKHDDSGKFITAKLSAPQYDKNEKHLLTTVLAEIEKQQHFLNVEWKNGSVSSEKITPEKINRLYHEKLEYSEKLIAILKELSIIQAKQINLTDEMYRCAMRSPEALAELNKKAGQLRRFSGNMMQQVR